MALKIGDEVKVAGRTFLGVVTCVDYYDYPGISNKAEILTGSGRCMTEPIIQLEKTGRHFPQIAEVLKQLKGRRRGMKLIVEVPEGMLDELRTCKFPIQEAYRLCEVIENGTPLPKGHGRLIDADALKLTQHDIHVESINYRHRCISVENIDEAPTIIEADKEYGVKAITRGNCMACGKELTEGVFFCKECEKKEQRKELIDRKALKEELDRNYGRKEYCSHDVIEDIIYHVPTIEERKTGSRNDETKQKICDLECENRILRHCLAEAFSMEHSAGFLIREYNRLIDTRQGYDEQVDAFESARREYDRFEERKAMGKVVNVSPCDENLAVPEGGAE